MDVVTIYKRILSRMKPHELECSSNSILQDELVGVRSAMDNIVATFAKVGEVRDAVNHLEQQGKQPSSGRSASLMDVMDETLELHEQLQHKVRKLAAGMEGIEQAFGNGARDDSPDQRKRKQHGVASSEASSPSEKEGSKPKKRKLETNVDKVERHKAKKREEQGQVSADWTLAHDALDSILKVKTADKKVSEESKKQWSTALSAIKRVLEHQSQRDAHTTDNAAVEVAAHALEAAVKVLQKIKVASNEVQSLVTAVTDACNKNEVLRRFLQRARAQLENIETRGTLSPSKKVGKQSGASDSPSLTHRLQNFENLVNSMQTQPPEMKFNQILEALDLMDQVMAGDAMGEYKVQVRASMNTVKRWINKSLIRNNMIKKYIHFLDTINAYRKKLPDKREQKEWQSQNTSIRTLLDERIKWKGSSTKEEMQKRLMSVIQQAKDWQDGVFSLDQLDKEFKTLNDVVSYRLQSNPKAGEDMRNCLKLLTTCVQKIKKKAHRDKRLKTLKKWEALLKK
ncbi:hypothetical protein PsorP6_016758 [Peronosclerospora sorghi]|uniref:Uncharacterized protein n=1 Tax=Peronosclerospora sorghi TaxID=230839 RepID=A0ACC0WFG7_9STRA|nr:hypothetical protein PsorP6_016758 [Peronosclerospora sorghi]